MLHLCRDLIFDVHLLAVYHRATSQLRPLDAHPKVAPLGDIDGGLSPGGPGLRHQVRGLCQQDAETCCRRRREIAAAEMSRLLRVIYFFKRHAFCTLVGVSPIVQYKWASPLNECRRAFCRWRGCGGICSGWIGCE